MIAQIAVMKIIGKVRSDVRGDASRKVPGNLRTIGSCSWYTQFVSSKETANVDLVRRVALQFIVAVSRVEVPFGSEIVVQANHPKVVIPNERHIGFKFLDVQMVTTA